MPPAPVAERHPPGLGTPWVHVWQNALKTLKEQGTWSLDLAPLLREYVLALEAADEARGDGEHTTWDRHAKRAHQLAHTLVLTPESRRKLGIGSDEDTQDPFADFDGDEAARHLRLAG